MTITGVAPWAMAKLASANNKGAAISTTAMPSGVITVLPHILSNSVMGTSVGARSSASLGFGYSATAGAIAGLHQEVKESSKSDDSSDGNSSGVGNQNITFKGSGKPHPVINSCFNSNIID